MGGDEFVVLIVDATKDDLANMQARLQVNVDAHNLQIAGEYALAFSMGGVWVDSKSTITMEALLSQADEAMYKHKMSRRRKTA